MTLACYARKSNHMENDSIENQLAVIKAYISSQPDFRSAEILDFTDNGCSGIDIERNAFQELLSLVRQRRIDVIIVKDLSRLGRNYLDVCKLTESILPFMKVCLIAVSDNYDSQYRTDSTLDLSMTFKAILNEFYLEESSLKIQQSYQQRIRNGEFCGSVAYGYALADRYTIQIVPEEAEIVREIFTMYLDGQSSVQIARTLNQRNVPTQRNRKWLPNTILKMLKNEQYIGRKTALKKQRHVKTKQITYNAESGWYINDHAFPPIVEREIFDRVQEHFHSEPDAKQSTASAKPEHIMSRKLYCAGCGKTLKIGKSFQCKKISMLLVNPHAFRAESDKKYYTALCWNR